MLGGDEEFAGKGRLGGAALQRFFGGEADEIGIVVFLRDVREDEIARDRVEAVGVGKILAYGVIRKMACAAQDPLLDHPGIRADLEHVEIVIGFKDQAVRATKMDFDELGHVAEVGDDGHFRAVRTKGESDGISRVVRNGESVHIDIADGEMLARLDGFDAVQPLAERFREHPLHCPQRGLGDVQRRFPQAEHLRETVAVVGVLVGDKDAVDVVDGLFDSRESGERFALAETGVHEEAGALGLEQRDVARAAGRQDGNAQTDRFLLNFSVQFRFETNFQNDGRAPGARQLGLHDCNGDILPPRTMEKYDLIVVGSGPGGQRAAIQAAKFGKRAALIEKLEVIGGTAINTGTIPSKTIREAVLHLSGYQYQSIYGVNYRVKEQITMADLSFRALNVIKTEIDVIRAQLSRNGIEVVTGTASFLDPHHMQVTSSRGQVEFEAGNIVIATGTKPAVSPLVPFNNTTIINSDQILRMPEIPKSMIVVGGGVIGVEYTCMFATLGVRVTLIEKRPRLLEFADAEMVEALCYHLRDRRVTLRLNEEVESVEETPDRLVVANLKSKKKVSGEALLYAVGRQGNVDELNLAAGGLEADARGRIPVDENYQTKQPHVYAVGDVIGFPSLGSVSMEQGRIAAARAFGMPTNSNRANYPYGIYTIPEISFIGKTEEQLTEEGVPYEVGMAFFREIARGQIRGDTTGRLKLIFDPATKELLGVHIIGEGASELLHIGQAVFALKGTVEYFVDTVFNYPTLAECYKAAAFNGLNKLVRT